MNLITCSTPARRPTVLRAIQVSKEKGPFLTLRADETIAPIVMHVGRVDYVGEETPGAHFKDFIYPKCGWLGEWVKYTGFWDL